MDRFIIDNDEDGENRAEEVQIMAWGPDEQEAMIRHFVGIEAEDDEISDVEVEVVSTDITEMSIESLLELINKNVEEGNDVTELDREMNMRPKFIDMVEEFEHGGEMMNSMQKYELLMKIWSEAAR